MNKRIAACAVGAVALALAATGCSSNGSSSTSTPSPTGPQAVNINEQPYSAIQTGGTLNLSIGEIVSNKNTYNTDGNTTDGAFLAGWYMPAMMYLNTSGDMVVNPDYLTSVKADTVNGATVVTYDINPKAKFNDGTPIDIKAFQNTWNQNNGKDTKYNSASTDGWSQMKSVEQGTSPLQVVVTYNGIYPYWNTMFGSVMDPACSSVDCFNNGWVGTDLASAHPEWGAGPYTLQSLDSKAGIATFVRNPKWWGNPGKLDKIVLTQRESTAQVSAFQNGEADAVQASTADILKQVQTVANTQTRQGVSTSNALLEINSTNGVMSDIKVRQAIFTGINREQIDQVQFQGLNYKETPPGSLLLFSYQKGYTDNFSKVIPKSDPAAAKAILEADGYTMGSDGYYAKDGKQLAISFTIFGNSQNTTTRAQVIQAQMKAIGINMSIVPKASSDFSSVISQGNFQMTLLGFSQNAPNGVQFLCQVYCSPSDPNFSGLNVSGTGTKELDAEIHEIEKLPTIDQQVAAANPLEVKEFQTFGVMPLFNGPQTFQVKSSLANVGAGGLTTSGNYPTSGLPENIGFTTAQTN